MVRPQLSFDGFSEDCRTSDDFTSRNTRVLPEAGSDKDGLSGLIKTDAGGTHAP